MECSSDEDYNPLEEDCETEAESSDDELVESEDFSDLDERIVEGGWRLIRDIFSDKRPEPKPPFTSGYFGINPHFTEATFSQPSVAFQ